MRNYKVTTEDDTVVGTVTPKGEEDLDLVKALHTAGHLPGWARTSLDLLDVVFVGEDTDGSTKLEVIDPHTNNVLFICTES